MLVSLEFFVVSAEGRVRKLKKHSAIQADSAPNAQPNDIHNQQPDWEFDE